MEQNERDRRRAESRRRAHRNDLIAVAVIVLAIAIAIVAVSCGLSGSLSGGGETTTSNSTTGSTSSTVSSDQTTDVTSTTTAAATVTTTTTTKAPTTTTKKPTTTRPDVVIDPTGRYVQPSGAQWNLILVNDWNKMPSDWEEKMTTTVINASAQNGKVDSRIADSLNAMVAACRAAGGTIWAQSMYRPYDIQEALFERAVDRYVAQGYGREKAEILANTEVKRPGYSEHNTGLAVDFNSCSHDFTGTTAHKWLVEHCAEYGFILRFPEGKEDVTGVMYESWHYRYVGKEAATEIMAKGITLEEYCEQYGL